ncbi:MAG: NADH-quinone oxidoreductase subunit F [Nitrospirae bacterium CG_4_9_14_3_um_filter_53_35]|nr:MAG: NADH oxidoreductase (quinone) subunit F [Nitrospirae bacterium CG2_30_53_67]PIV83206.1 MAG: NADH-quinone oxidoreductase subunit F [Nitrospirae bacterium CG17_big_fil_post_rev_8_21_14_2_50_50_9]PIW85341.1 MAG: NADH-quinone oxidoreductase subunit F [Nitrospirae bacterium CG_4_8_14_3_um_filter_50_41]PIX86534.1 MAG: NADH-quinone oxidoreductase subunit F [Nitrospirae bacterium CG_4_10_14_3_um_filter_53_41]PJA74734.1 MAG: NADH-quinone oxidoreductase subunit F [Nitrospirae bacterium CG_4_9_14_
METILLNRIHLENSRSISVYMAHEGYEALKKALSMPPAEVVNEVKRANLRGRGGAGFPAAMKWGFAAADPKKPKYLLCNADEGEPGTCKDRQIMEGDPHELIEGMIIAGYAFGAEYGYIYLRAEYPRLGGILDQAISEAEEKGFLGKDICHSGFNFTIRVHRGAGAYICGEETALIESLEGKRGQSRIKPPFPVNVGAFGLPTVINNVETLANVPHIILKGGDWFAGIGPAKCPGTRIISLSGHVNRPGYYELPMGVSFREVIYEHGGGIRDGKELKAFIPGGASSPCLTPNHLNVGMDYDSVSAAGSMLGSSALMVMDQDTCMVKVAGRLMRFFVHESCGRCTPCREGTDWLLSILDRIEAGGGKEGDIELLRDICDNIAGKTFCPLGEGALGPVRGTLKYFEEEYREHIRIKGCTLKI